MDFTLNERSTDSSAACKLPLWHSSSKTNKLFVLQHRSMSGSKRRIVMIRRDAKGDSRKGGGARRQGEGWEG